MIILVEMKRIVLITLLISTVIRQPIIAQNNMILISGGSYKMGDFTGKSYVNERPVHDVFWIHFT